MLGIVAVTAYYIVGAYYELQADLRNWTWN